MQALDRRPIWIAVGLVVGLLVSLICLVEAQLRQIKTVGDSLQPIVQIAAIAVAGLWSWRLFVKNRIEYPYPKIDHRITHWPILGSEVYLSVIATVTNAGNVLLHLESGKVFVQQVRPLFPDLEKLIREDDDECLREGKVLGLFEEDGLQIAWREIGYREPTWKGKEIQIEPGECEELEFDFILTESVQTVKVKTYFKNVKRKIDKDEVGWSLTTIYDLEKPNGK